MAPPDDVTLGPLSRQVIEGAAWLSQDEYPAHQPYADELEQLLGFLDANGRLQKFTPRLRDVAREHRDATLAEVRTAYFLNQTGFQISEWEPLAVGTTPGDLTIRFGDAASIFVEVKAPSWIGELGRSLRLATGEERQRILERIEQEKYRNGEARAVNPSGTVIDVIDNKALPKLADDRPNLIAVVDDLYSPVVGNPLVPSRFATAFVSRPGWNRIGGILALKASIRSGQLVYQGELTLNSSPLPSCQLPSAAICALQSALAENDQACWTCDRQV